MDEATEQPKDYTRYCPGEEAIRISNAICRGRRRANFPKCKGCQFNDDEREAAGPRGERAALPSADASQVMGKLFKAYDVRGIALEVLSGDAAWRIGHATAQFLRTKLSGRELTTPNGRSIVVGRDIRTHSPMLQAAFIEGARAAGMDVVNIGLIDTSQIYFAVNHLGACGGVQTTASHNPAQYNGFKICASGGKPVGAGTGLESIRDIASRVPRHQTGTTARMSEVDLSAPYRDFVRRFLHEPLARPMRVVVDASNGSAGRWVPIVLGGAAGLELVPLYFETTGRFEHEPNPLVESNLAELKKRVAAEKAHFGACFDGDADRCAFVDEKGQTVRADFVSALLARAFLEKNPGAAIVYDLRSSRVLAEEIEKAGGVAVRQRVGHAFMKKAMADHNGVFGGELSGHFYFRDNWYCDSGLLAFVHVLNLLADSGRKLSELLRPLKRYATSGEINFENPDADGTIARLLEKYGEGECDELDGVTVQYPTWWFNVRKSNTEPLVRLNIEADTKKLLDERLKELAAMLGKRVEH